MAIGSKQIGWSNESNLLWEISKKLDGIITSLAPTPTTTTTTTTAPPPNLTLRIAPNTNFDIPQYDRPTSSGNFTIEWFAKMTADDNHPRPWSIGSWPDAAHAVSIENGELFYWIGGNIVKSATVTNHIGNWTHFCIMRYPVSPFTNSDIGIYINGELVGTIPSYNGAIPTNGLPLYLGSEGNDSLQNGLMSNFRWNNTAVYDEAGFTPPTSPLTAVSGTKLLIFQGSTLANEIIDQSETILPGDIVNGTGVYNADNPVGTQGSIQFGTV